MKLPKFPTLKRIMNNAILNVELDRLFILIFKYDNYSSIEGVDENFHKDISQFTDSRQSYILKITNGLIEENKRLKNIIENSNKGSKPCQS